MSNKANFTTRKIIRDKMEHYIMIKESVNQEHTAILNIYITNNELSKFIRQKLIEIKGEIDKTTAILGNLNTSLSVIYR